VLAESIGAEVGSAEPVSAGAVMEEKRERREDRGKIECFRGFRQFCSSYLSGLEGGKKKKREDWGLRRTSFAETLRKQGATTAILL